MKINIYKIAEKAKVSIATVSRAMDPETRSKVSPRTLKRIENIAKKYHYTPHSAARNLVKTTYKTIGVILPHGPGVFYDDYNCHLLAGISDTVLDSEYKLKLLILKSEQRDWDAYNFRASESIDGLIVAHWHAFFKNKTTFKDLKIPCIIISDPEKDLWAYCISGDHELGGRLAAEHLYSRGHRKIAVMTGPRNSPDSSLRVKGFEEYLKQKNVSLDPDLMVCGEFQEHRAWEAAQDLAAKRDRFTAVFCCNDEMAFGVIRKFSELGIHCPKDISVMGYDGHLKSGTFEVPLTTVQVPLYEIAKKAAQTLIHSLKEKKPRDFFGHQNLFPVTLVPRKSVNTLL